MTVSVANREAVMAEEKDGRLDRLGKQVGYLTGRVDEMGKRLDDLSRRVDGGFAHVDARFDALQRTLVQVGGGVVVALLGLIATQV
jgi:tetrahydromethanopterin S-methyltransferase subunit G